MFINATQISCGVGRLIVTENTTTNELDKYITRYIKDYGKSGGKAFMYAIVPLKWKDVLLACSNNGFTPVTKSKEVAVLVKIIDFDTRQSYLNKKENI